jgi:hypothetical protein
MRWAIGRMDMATGAAHAGRGATRRMPAVVAAALCAALLAAGCAGPADSIAAAVRDAWVSLRDCGVTFD